MSGFSAFAVLPMIAPTTIATAAKVALRPALGAHGEAPCRDNDNLWNRLNTMRHSLHRKWRLSRAARAGNHLTRYRHPLSTKARFIPRCGKGRSAKPDAMAVNVPKIP
jgi:hypothetical protein